MNYTLGVDPGREKCGLALLDANGKCVVRYVVSRADLVDEVLDLAQRHPIDSIVLGDRTGSKEALQQLQESIGRSTQTRGMKIELVPEHLSSVEGRRQYLIEHRRGWRRLLPIGLQNPPEPFDDYTAEVIARRHFTRQNRS